jgi:hypothetical protein
MKKTLLCMTMIIGATSCTRTPIPSPSVQIQATGEKPEETVIDDGAFPSDWSIGEIAKAAHPLAVPSNSHILAWKRKEDNRRLLDEQCLVLCRISISDNVWYLSSLYRHPDGNGNADWQKSIWHIGPSDDDPIGHWEVHCKSYDKRPTNKDIYDFIDRYRWRVGVDNGWTVCKTTWETVLNEKPIRDFIE